LGNEEARLRDGGIIYILENTTHSTINDGEETIDFFGMWGLYWKEEKREKEEIKNNESLL
jgi:oxalate decarboxylase/phosphoglucose isomerase-like protein (cupin superfamily)